MTKKTVFIASVILFMLVLPLVRRIDFPQNDDWVYYEMVGRFMDGDFKLHEYTGPTFYSQGFIGAGFSKLFGLKNLPILTLIISVLNFYLLVLYISTRLKKEVKLSLLLGLLFFFNPLSIYLTLGFMTGVYFMFLLLVSLWFFSLYDETNNYKYFAALILTIFIGLLVRQVALFIPLGLGFFYLYEKKFKPSILLFTTFVAFYFYYLKIFPQTARMNEIPLQLQHLINFDYSYALIYGVFIMLVAFLLPAVLSSFDFQSLIKNKKKTILLLTLAVSLYYLGNINFNPHEISWGEFPYFENTFERTGFYPRGIHGTKYFLRWNYDVYFYWDLIAKILLSGFVAYLILNRKKVINEYSSLAFVYIVLLVVTETFYDRYIYVLVPLLILFLTKNYLVDSIKTKTFLLGGVLFFIFFSYQLANDFVLANKYVWEKSLELVRENDVAKNKIHGTNAWKLTNVNQTRDYNYIFSYDSPQVNPDFRERYKLVEEKEIKFIGNIFINSRIYLYKAL